MNLDPEPSFPPGFFQRSQGEWIRWAQFVRRSYLNPKEKSMTHITPTELELWQKNNLPFALLDVRRAGVRNEHGAEIPQAHWHDPAAWLDWKDSVAAEAQGKPIVVYCAKGHEIGQGLTAALKALGADARYLVGGMQGWLEEGHTVQKIG
jgi:thiosulfate sulfurtransferase